MLHVSVPASESSGVRRGFEDGFGRRYRPAARLDSDTPLEILCFRHEITDVPAFEFALRERVARLSDFHHPSFARIRKVDRLNDERGTVTLMGDGVAGVRLIDVLMDVEHTGRVLDVNSALYLVRQLLSAIAALHQHARVAHGALAPERLFVTPHGRLLIVEYTLGAALEQLKYSRERYWKELRVALPSGAGLPRLDERADLTQVGAVALSLLLGRPLRDDEYPLQIEHLVASASARTAGGADEPLPPALREWLCRALQLDARNSYRSVADAQAAFDQLLSGNVKYNADPDSLETFMQRYHGLTTLAPSPEPPIVRPNTSGPIARTETRPVTPSFEPFEPFEPSEPDEPDEPYEPYEPLPLPEIDSPEISDEGAHELDSQEDAMRSARTGTRHPARVKWIVAGVALLAATTAGLFAARQRLSPAIPPVTTGTLTVNTDPPSAEIEVDGATRGRSPISLALAAGAHTLIIRGHGQSRTIPITITAGAEVSQYLDLPKAGSDLGQLQVRTDPPGARISIDGTPLGKTPMTIVELAPGEHTVTLENDLGSVTQKVMIEAGDAGLTRRADGRAARSGGVWMALGHGAPCRRPAGKRTAARQ